MDVYTRITQRIIDQLEEGTVPWQKPWRISLPKNFVSKKTYRGINLLMLAFAGYSSSCWATFKQIKRAGGSVNKGEKATPVVYWNWVPSKRSRNVEDKKEPSAANEEPKGHSAEVHVPFLRYYHVFNLEQTSGIDLPEEEQETEFEPIKACEKLVSGMPDQPPINFDGGGRAFYRPITDSVHLPRPSSFKSAEEYYSCLFHELIHSTGHKTRLARDGVVGNNHFGTEKYSKEELVAEIGASFLSGMSGIEKATIDNSASYISGWLKALKDDRKLVVVAAAQSQKAVDYIKGD